MTNRKQLEKILIESNDAKNFKVSGKDNKNISNNNSISDNKIDIKTNDDKRINEINSKETQNHKNIEERNLLIDNILSLTNN